MSRFDPAAMAAGRCDEDTLRINAVEGRELACEHGLVMPTLDDALARNLSERRADVPPHAESASGASDPLRLVA